METEIALNGQTRRGPSDSQSFGQAENELRQRLRDVIDLGRTQRSLAREAGVSEEALSQWVRDKFEGDRIAMFQKLEQWEANQQAAADAKLPIVASWVETESGRNIERTLLFAQSEPSIAVIYGGAGVGKTTGVARYAASNPNVWAVSSSPAANGLSATLADVAAALGLRGLPNYPYQVSRDIVQRVRGTHGLLVIDEAQHLSVPALEQLRAVHDVGGIGLCLSGNETVYSKMTGGSRRAGFAQLFSRVGCRLRLSAPSNEDVDAILAKWQIEGDQEVKYGRQIAALPGGLRGLFQCLRQAGMAARTADKPVNLRLMRAAWRDLGGDT